MSRKRIEETVRVLRHGSVMLGPNQDRTYSSYSVRQWADGSCEYFLTIGGDLKQWRWVSLSADLVSKVVWDEK